ARAAFPARLTTSERVATAARAAFPVRLMMSERAAMAARAAVPVLGTAAGRGVGRGGRPAGPGAATGSLRGQGSGGKCRAAASTLTRGGGTGWWAGASSVQQIDTNGYVQFSTNESNLDKMAGLSHGDDDQGYPDIDYAIFLRGDGGIEIYEHGSSQGYFGTY